MATNDERARWARGWDRAAPRTDASMRLMDRVLFRDSRARVCGRATGRVLEVRVLAPGGLLLPADHVAAGPAPLRGLQWLVERASVPAMGEHFRRRPAGILQALGLRIEYRERFALGIVERLAARKP